jgi:hypothetical protein
MRPPDLTRSPTSSRRRVGIIGHGRCSPSPLGERTARSASIGLGLSHPLTRGIDAVGCVSKQWLTCAALMGGAVIARIEGDAWAGAGPRTRDTPARTLEMMVRQALRPPSIMMTGARPLFSLPVIAGVAPDLRALISALRTENARARGVSLLERLITHGDSPLYGREAAVLREELGRVRSALGSNSVQGGM